MKAVVWIRPLATHCDNRSRGWGSGGDRMLANAGLGAQDEKTVDQRRRCPPWSQSLAGQAVHVRMTAAEDQLEVPPPAERPVAGNCWQARAGGPAEETDASRPDTCSTRWGGTGSDAVWTAAPMWLAQRRRAGSQKTGQREAGRLEMPRFGGRGSDSSEYYHRNLGEKRLHTTQLQHWHSRRKYNSLWCDNVEAN